MKSNDTARQFTSMLFEMDDVYHQMAVTVGLSDSGLQILYMLHEAWPQSCPLSQVRKAMGLGRQTMNSALRKLEQEGLVRLEARDKKSKNAILTEKGADLAEKTVGRLVAIENRIFDGWSPEKQAMLLELTENYLMELKKGAEELKGVKEQKGDES